MYYYLILLLTFNILIEINPKAIQNYYLLKKKIINKAIATGLSKQSFQCDQKVYATTHKNWLQLNDWPHFLNNWSYKEMFK